MYPLVNEFDNLFLNINSNLDLTVGDLIELKISILQSGFVVKEQFIFMGEDIPYFFNQIPIFLLYSIKRQQFVKAVRESCHADLVILCKAHTD